MGRVWKLVEGDKDIISEDSDFCERKEVKISENEEHVFIEKDEDFVGRLE